MDQAVTVPNWVIWCLMNEQYEGIRWKLGFDVATTAVVGLSSELPIRSLTLPVISNFSVPIKFLTSSVDPMFELETQCSPWAQLNQGTSFCNLPKQELISFLRK